jgi:RHS repeat-associated protein
MVAVKSSGTILESYAYDGRGFRAAAEVDDITTHDYFNDSWQVIEQRVGSSTSARSQLVWSAAYVDALVQEKRDTDADGSLDRTLYATHDANFNVTAAVTPGAIAQQRFLYDAYGARSVLALDWQPTTSPPILDHGHQGGRVDAASGFALFRHRYLSPNLMRWTSRDPAGYVDGGSLLQYVGGDPVRWVDPEGARRVQPPDGRPPTKEECDEQLRRDLEHIANVPRDVWDDEFRNEQAFFAYRRWDRCRYNVTYHDGIKLCTRALRVQGGSLAPEFLRHRWISFNSNTLVGYGWTATTWRTINPMDGPNKNEVTDCRDCRRTSGKLQYGTGAGKSAVTASRAEIEDCVAKTPTARAYDPVRYNCRDWTNDAEKACGLKCDGESRTRTF